MGQCAPAAGIACMMTTSKHGTPPGHRRDTHWKRQALSKVGFGKYTTLGLKVTHRPDIELPRSAIRRTHSKAILGPSNLLLRAVRM